MEVVIGEVFKHLVSFGPWAVLGGLALYLLRTEIGRIFVAPKEDRAVEGALLEIHGLFEKNLVYFEKTANNAETMVALMRELNATQHSILNELIRGKGR